MAWGGEFLKYVLTYGYFTKYIEIKIRIRIHLNLIIQMCKSLFLIKNGINATKDSCTVSHKRFPVDYDLKEEVI